MLAPDVLRFSVERKLFVDPQSESALQGYQRFIPKAQITSKRRQQQTSEYIKVDKCAVMVVRQRSVITGPIGVRGPNVSKGNGLRTSTPNTKDGRTWHQSQHVKQIPELHDGEPQHEKRKRLQKR